MASEPHGRCPQIQMALNSQAPVSSVVTAACRQVCSFRACADTRDERYGLPSRSLKKKMKRVLFRFAFA